MTSALTIAAKDLRQRARDRSLLLIAVIVPLTLAVIFGLTLHDVSGGHVHFEFAYVDQDHGAVARLFKQRALDEAERRRVASIRVVPSLEQGRKLASRGSVQATFVLRHGFTSAVVRRRPATIEVLGNVDRPIGTLVARSIAGIFAARTNATRIANALIHGRRSTVPAPLIRIEDVSAQRKELDSATFYAAGMAVFFLFFAVQSGILSILGERRDGTLARLLAAPIPRISVLAGKALATVAAGIASMATLALATHFLLDAHWGNPLPVALLIVAGVLAATAVMMLVAGLARSVEQAGTWGAIVALVLGMLGGSFFPIARAGGFLGKLTFLTPHAWFLRGLEHTSAGEGIGSIARPAAALLLIAAVCAGAALTRTGRLLRP